MEDLASSRQRQIMRKFNIPFTEKTTAKEAFGLIQESMSKTKATEKQIETLEAYNIPYASDITSKKANELIQESIGNEPATSKQMQAIRRICENSNGACDFNKIDKNITRSAADILIKEIYEKNSDDYSDYRIRAIYARSRRDFFNT